MIYRERVTPSWTAYLAGALIVPAVLVVFLPIYPGVGAILALVAFAGFVVLMVNGSPVIEIDATTLRVGSAKVPLRYVGEAVAHPDRESARQAAGPGLDARAWTCLRGWATTSVRVDIDDANDPIPYWLFSSRDPEAVVAALERARTKLKK